MNLIRHFRRPHAVKTGVFETKKNKPEITDIALVLEGTYPYVAGGVSGWCHELIKEQPDLTFSLICLTPRGMKLVPKYEIPENVVEIVHVELQKLKWLRSKLTLEQKAKFCQGLEEPLLRLATNAKLEDLQEIIDLGKALGRPFGGELLTDSEESFDLLCRMYDRTLPNSSFLDYFWSWRSLLGGLFSVLLAPIPKSKVYHSLCTGFAGLYLSRVSLETKRPCMLTEHGIYTNERRIEIGTAAWLDDQASLNFNVDQRLAQRSLRDFWIDSFTSYSRLTYQTMEIGLTLYEGNKELQLEDGALPEQLKVVPNGIDYETYSKIERKQGGRLIVGFIGRVVPIKDVKTLIRAAAFVNQVVSDAELWIMGPTDEDQNYFDECQAMVEATGMDKVIKFLGKVNIKDYAGKIDILVLTSLSEAQPLVILELGAVGVPTVATDVGACSELLYGAPEEEPKLGPGGVICPLASPTGVAEGIIRLYSDRKFYESCSKAIKARVAAYYRKEDQHRSYREIYNEMMRIEEVDSLARHLQRRSQKPTEGIEEVEFDEFVTTEWEVEAKAVQAQREAERAAQEEDLARSAEAVAKRLAEVAGNQPAMEKLIAQLDKETKNTSLPREPTPEELEVLRDFALEQMEKEWSEEDPQNEHFEPPAQVVLPEKPLAQPRMVEPSEQDLASLFALISEQPQTLGSLPKDKSEEEEK
ncbi:MAG: hypothetical protein A2527_02305 [Candidatus Lambdaproteobacteria bacterium RIFOXYD2_FULL_50_16]|uniref:Glycosyl transferase family 1 n=1 Tax=Candidatus Lambdaproteobacteria bacterium RIFOXYD2_FULL_50_16 TaxID=1817772 RepID=A0A1F6GDV7_9PROT|nr:MAG: hypothetical protein A2527_02305 [Candidatus Lambdaproteobacteria bacterium RIFOXYD2_FULL_50_16]